MRRKMRIIKFTAILLVCILLSGGLSFFYFGIHKNNQLVSQYEKKIEAYKIDLNTDCYILNKDVNKNSKVKNEDLTLTRIPNELNSESLVTSNKKVKDSFYSEDYKKGTILYKNMVYDYDNVASDLRQYELSSVLLPSDIEVGNYIDVRISFPNGLDYVVLSKKKVRSISKMEKSEKENLTTLYLDSEEILRLSSAMVDSYMNDEVKLYSTIYLDPPSQKASKVTYPNNPVVEKLLKEDGNVLSRADSPLANPHTRNHDKINESKEKDTIEKDHEDIRKNSELEKEKKDDEKNKDKSNEKNTTKENENVEELDLSSSQDIN